MAEPSKQWARSGMQRPVPAPGQVPMQTASMVLSSRMARQFSVMAGMPNCSATARAEPSVRLATAVMATPGIACSPGMCLSRVLAPAPMTPTVMEDVSRSAAITRGGCGCGCDCAAAAEAAAASPLAAGAPCWPVVGGLFNSMCP